MLQISLLGRFDIHLNDEPLELGLQPVQLLLAYLLLNRATKHRREQLAGILWPGYTGDSARKNLRNTLYRLRQAIGEEYLLADRNTMAFNLDAPYWLDVAQLEDAASESIPDLIQVAGLYQGELLPGYYEDWILLERERLAALFERHMGRLLDRLAAAGRWHESLTWAEHWIAQGRVPEPAYRALMTAHAALGDQAAMAQAYRRARQALEEELGVPPSPETERLYRELLAASPEDTPTLAQPAVGQPPEKIARSGLPQSITPFIGRRRELAELGELLGGENGTRLLAIVGPGGIGKTRLSLAVAAAAEAAFPDGAFFVPLAPLAEPQHIVTAISDAIGFLNATGGDPRQSLLNYLGDKRLLLVMDNFEHLLAGAGILTDILHHAPRVKILSTSRERLNLSSEAVYPLSGLDYPADPSLAGQEITRFGAVQLLLDRARLVRPGLEVGGPELEQAARICWLVQGMPLALVLAAGWLELLTFAEVADEIAASLDILASQARDMPERQRSVRATFDYSWRRLAAVEREVFSRLAVFRGGFSRQAAQEVARAGLPGLRTLVEKSFISAERPDRYAVHVLLGQFAEEKLEATGQAGPIRDAHSRYYLEAVAQREADLKGQRQLKALDEIETDLGNVRAASTWALAQGDEQRLDQALESLFLFFFIRSRNQEGWSFFQRAIQQLEKNQPPNAQARRLWGRLMARACLLHSQFTKSAPEIPEALQKSLAIAGANADEAEIAYSYLAFGYYHSRVTDDYEQALDYFERSLERYQALGDRFYVAHLLHRLGYCYSFTMDNEVYMDYTRQSLDLARQTGDLFNAANAMGNLGSGSFATGDYGRAEEYLREAISLGQQMRIPLRLAHETILFALSQLLKGNLHEAGEAAAQGIAMAKEILFPLSEAYGLAVLSLCASLEDDPGLGHRLAAESLALDTNLFGEFLGHWALATAHIGLGQMEEAWSQTRVILAISYRRSWPGNMTWLLPLASLVLAHDGQSERAAELLGLYFNHPLRPVGWAEKWALLDQWQTRLQDNLGPGRYQAAWERGQYLDLRSTVATLLADQLH